MKEVVFCGGCFWCTEAVFKRLKGVVSVCPGYTGGFVKNPAYREVCQGTTGHAEGVKIVFDSTIIAFEELLEVFFATHDPTTLNRQGHDMGTQYRSAIYYSTDKQKDIVNQFIVNLNHSKIYKDPIVTTVLPLTTFYDAELDHKDYYDLNTEQSYCQYVILPKINLIKKRFISKLK